MLLEWCFKKDYSVWNNMVLLNKKIPLTNLWDLIKGVMTLLFGMYFDSCAAAFNEVVVD